MSRSPSAKYGVPCGTCGAGADEPCRSAVTKRVTDTHAARLKLYWKVLDERARFRKQTRI